MTASTKQKKFSIRKYCLNYGLLLSFMFATLIFYDLCIRMYKYDSLRVYTFAFISLMAATYGVFKFYARPSIRRALWGVVASFPVSFFVQLIIYFSHKTEPETYLNLNISEIFISILIGSLLTFSPAWGCIFFFIIPLILQADYKTVE